MYLDRLEIFGFKSFAKKTTLIFPPGVTGIVGPNGCGKSNFSDSIRWILGEQSLKNLRAGKNDDLIFSARKSRLNFTEATLYLKDNEGKAEENFKISRKFFRNGENEYWINNNQVKKEDLILFLAKINFSQKGYSIVGQGMVDWILYSSKQERKEFFDEATGIKEFQIKKNKAANKIKRGLKNLSQAEVAINEVEPRLKFLSRQIKKWEKRQEIEQELIDLEKKYYGGRLCRLAKEKGEINKKIDEKNKILEKENSDLKNFQNELQGIASYEPDKEFKKTQQEWEETLTKRNKLIDEKARFQVKIYKEKEGVLKPTIDQIDFVEYLKDLMVDQEKLIGKLRSFNFQKEEIIEIEKLAEEILAKIKKNIVPKTEFQTKENKENIELERIDQEILDLNTKFKNLEEKLSKFLGQENEKRKEMLEIQNKLQTKQNLISSINYELRAIEMEKVKIETHEEDLKNEIEKNAFFKDISSLSQIDLSAEEEVRTFSTIQRLKREMDLIGSFDESLFGEYKECKEKYDFLFSQIDDLKKSIVGLEDIKIKLEEKIRDEFFSNFNKINENFEQYFQFLFKGGKSELILEEEKKELEIVNGEESGENTEEEEKEESSEIKYGVEIYARPPGKKIKNIQSLSGGEKALTSLALIFAILKTKKPPFIVLDEVDAALDEANSVRLAEIIKDLSKNTQIIVITHNPITMEAASALYGVTMDKDNISHLVSLKLENA